MINTLTKAALDAARGEIVADAHEMGGENNGPFVAKYLSTVGLRPPQPWCAAFVCWIWNHAANQLAVSMPFKPNASALSLWEELEADNRQVFQPRPGDLAFWHRGPVDAHFGHVGIIEFAHYSAEHGSVLIQSIEGNIGNRVTRRKHVPLHEPIFIGYARVVE